MTHSIGSRTWVLAEVPSIPLLTPRIDVERPRQAEPPSVVTQHTVTSPSYVLLSSKVNHNIALTEQHLIIVLLINTFVKRLIRKASKRINRTIKYTMRERYKLQISRLYK